VSQWIAAAMDALGRRCAVVGTLGNGLVGERHAELREPVEQARAFGTHEFGRGDHPSTPLRGACTLSVPGASGATDIMRSAEPITEENTGAPTSPP